MTFRELTSRYLPMPFETYVIFLAISCVWFFMIQHRHPYIATIFPLIFFMLSMTFVFLNYLTDRRIGVTLIQLIIVAASLAPMFIICLLRINS